MTLTEAFADWGNENPDPESPDRAKKRPVAHLKPVTRTSFDPKELVLVVRIELTEDDIGA